jgi:hypothetical protein
MIAQFWSAHSDSTFAALFLVSFVFLDRLLKDEAIDETRNVVAYTLAVMVAVFVRPAGLVLYPLHLLYVLWHREQLREVSRRHRTRFFLMVASAAVLVAWVGLGKLGHNPLLNLNRGEYDVPVAYLSTVAAVFVLVGITLGVLLVVTLPKLSVTRETAPLLAVLAVYVHVFMVFHASIYNLRYYVPVVPLMALFVVRGLRHLKRRALVAASLAMFVATNGAMIFAFNDAKANGLFLHVAPHRINWGEFGHFDNLQLDAQLQMKQALDRIDAELPPGATLYYVDAYYGGVAEGIYQDAGLLRPDLRIRYVKRLEELRTVPRDAWIFLAERHPGEQTVRPADWVVQRSSVAARLRN